MKNAIVFIYPFRAQERLRSDREGAQSDLSLRFAYILFLNLLYHDSKFYNVQKQGQVKSMGCP